MKCPKCQSDNRDTASFCSDCGTQLIHAENSKSRLTATLETPKEDLTTGSMFAGRYQIIEELGRGGMGKVYKVLDTRIEEKIALKLIKPEIASDEKTLTRFSNELKYARKITHPNVGRMYDLGEADGTHFITMEYVPGEDLKSMLKMSGQFNIGTAIKIAKQICAGLIEAHRRGIIHRDLKPNNIMIDKDGCARIMDFGIARSLRSRGITGEGIMIGTPEYMSPEQTEAKDVDARSDVYSLGIILFEMVTGKLPFQGDTPLSIALKHKTTPPPDPRQLNSRISDEISEVILRCLEKDENQRYQDMEALLSDLNTIERRLEASEMEHSKRTGRKPRTAELSSKKTVKRLVWALPIILIILGSLYLLLPKGEFLSSIAVLPFTFDENDPEMESLSDGLTERLISRLSQLQSLTVISRYSAFQYKGSRELDLKEVGRRLNVEALLLGRLESRQDGLFVVVELVNVENNSVVWMDQYNRKQLADLPSIQQEIATEISDRLKLRLSGEDMERLTRVPTENEDAFREYLRGRFYWNKRSEEGLLKGLEYFQSAIEKDPMYALAYVGQADSYGLLARYSYLPPDEAMPKGKAAVLKALEIDDTLGEAYTTLGFIRRYYDWDWDGSENDYRQAINLNPSYGTAHHWYALLLSSLGRHNEAISSIKRAQELDPLSIIINTNVAWIYYFAREYVLAEEQFKRTIEMDPNFGVAHLRLGRTYQQMGRHEDALGEFREAVRLIPESVEMLAALCHGHATSGNTKEALRILDRLMDLSGQKYVSPYDLATIHSALGDDERAVQWLNLAYDERCSLLAWIKVDPRLDALDSNPDFSALLKKLNLD